MKILDHGYLDYVEHWGSDREVIEAARMSTNKGFEGWDKDERLLKYLWTHKHATPFEMCGLTIEVQLPIFVVREWHRHRTQSYSEMSARYTPLPDLAYVPSVERMMHKPTDSRQTQGTGEALSERNARAAQDLYVRTANDCQAAYLRMLEGGVPKELARGILPVTRYTRMRASANLRNWIAFLKLRTAPDAQWEIREYALAVSGLLKEHFPRTHALIGGEYE